DRLDVWRDPGEGEHPHDVKRVGCYGAGVVRNKRRRDAAHVRQECVRMIDVGYDIPRRANAALVSLVYVRLFTLFDEPAYGRWYCLVARDREQIPRVPRSRGCFPIGLRKAE